MKLRKKSVSCIASVILAAVMAVSMVPAAFAAATDTEIGTTYTPIDSTHHHVHALYEDGEVYDKDVDCWFENGEPCICGNTKPAATDTSWCNHMNNNWIYEDLGDGTHNVVCKDCGETVSLAAACVYTDGKCVCGAEEPACNHMNNNWKYVDNGDGTHQVICADCGKVVTENAACVYTNGKCICGHKKVATDTSWCDHMNNNWIYEDLGNGTHNVVCADCGETVSQAVPCVYTDGKCVCGAEEPACDHMNNNWKYVDNGDGTHQVICADCGEVVTENAACVYTDGKCVCGAEEQTVAPVDPAEPEKPATPGGIMDSGFGMGYRPVHQFFQAVRNFFRNLFHRA